MGSKEAGRLAELLTRLKDLALVETGLLDDELSIEPVAVRELLASAADAFRPHLAGRAQTLVEQYPSEPVRALADRDALGRVLAMVIENSHRYTPKCGEITLSARAEGSHARIVIADDGPGIPPEELPRVFERFHRGDSQHVREVNGEGLGLYLCRQLLLAQRGTILLDSEPGNGTTVEIILRREEEE
jgi:signal transduction histidine kinase